MPPDLYSAEHFAAKQRRRIAAMTSDEFEPYDGARERYIQTKIEPTLQLYRESDHDAFKDFNRRKGEVIHSSDLIFRLQKLNPHVQCQQSVNFPGDWSIYAENLGRIQYLSAVPKGYLTEFSWALVDDRNLPTEERRGWRTVIVMCLVKGVVEWDDVILEFGEPQDGFNDARWQEATADIRHGGDGITERNIANSLEG